jgi:signal peptidase
VTSKGRIVWNTITTVLVSAIAVLAILLAGVRLFGLKPFAVLSGSMEPAYEVGSLIYVKNALPQDIKVGDPITFVLNEDLTVATHRVIKIDAGNQQFYTKGDANNAADGAPVHYNNLIGKPVFSIPKLGYVSGFLNTKRGTIIAITAAVVILMMIFIPDILKKAETDEAKKKNAENMRRRPEV